MFLRKSANPKVTASAESPAGKYRKRIGNFITSLA